MKKVISAIVAAALVAVLGVSLAACNKEPVDNPEPGSTNAAGATVEAGTEA